MRSFPSASRRRPVVAVVAAALVGGVLASPIVDLRLVGDKDLKQRQHRVEKRVDHAQHDLDESSKQLRAATARVERARHELVQARHQLAGVRTRLGQAREHNAAVAERLRLSRMALDDARVAAFQGQQRVALQRAALADTVNATYQQGDPQLLALTGLLNAGSTSDLTMAQQFNQAAAEKQAAQYDDFEEAADALAAARASVAETTQRVAASKADAQRQVDRLHTLTDQARAARERVQRAVGSAREARQHALRVQARDRAELRRLQARERAIKQRILRAAARAAARGENRSAHQAGFLLRPVPGVVTSPFGYRIHPIYHYWGLHDGTDFGVSCGEAMRAAGNGTVISKYYSSVYGNRLYVNLGLINGKNVTVVYNHATSYRVSVGDRVTRGETVGYVGSTGWSTGCHLHFTVLVNGTAVDPMTWID